MTERQTTIEPVAQTTGMKGWQPIDYQHSVYPYEAGLIQLWHHLWERGVSVGFYSEETDSWWLIDPEVGQFGVGINPSHWQELAAPPPDWSKHMPSREGLWEKIEADPDADVDAGLPAAPPMTDRPAAENLNLIRQQAEVYREMEPLLARLQKLAGRRGWPLGQNILRCAVDELERLTPTTTH